MCTIYVFVDPVPPKYMQNQLPTRMLQQFRGEGNFDTTCSRLPHSQPHIE